MAYLFRQKLRINELVDLPRSLKKVLIYEPENDLSSLYAHYIGADNFEIKHCPILPAVRKVIIHFNPDLLIFSLETATWPSSKRALTELINSFPNLQVVSTSFNLNHDDFRQLMALGVSSHINRSFSRPQDLAVIVKNILEH